MDIMTLDEQADYMFFHKYMDLATNFKLKEIDTSILMDIIMNFLNKK